MSLDSATGAASFDITAGTGLLDLSNELAEVIRADNTAFISRVGVNGFASTQKAHKWNEDSLNANTATLDEDLDASDLIIAISVPRYTSITIDFAQYAAKMGLKVISITDSRISPLFPVSSLCLMANIQSATFHNSNVALMALADAIIARVFDSNRDRAIQRLEREERILKDRKIIFYDKKTKN